MYDLSIILPSIRNKNLFKFYNKAKEACKKYKWELIIISPYTPDYFLLEQENIRYIYSKANSTICIQMGVLLATGKYIYHTVDDAIIQENAIDKSLDINLEYKDIINMRYTEGVLNADTLEPLSENIKEYDNNYWIAGTHDGLKISGVNPEWSAFGHFIMRTKYFEELGGLDCSLFEYNSYAILDMLFRAQRNGSKIYNSPIVATHCSHLPGLSGDHAPVHFAHTSDTYKFKILYSKMHEPFERIKIKYDFWKEQPQVWTRRFK